LSKTAALEERYVGDVEAGKEGLDFPPPAKPPAQFGELVVRDAFVRQLAPLSGAFLCFSKLKHDREPQCVPV
jgi:hypothetical protein